MCHTHSPIHFLTMFEKKKQKMWRQWQNSPWLFLSLHFPSSTLSVKLWELRSVTWCVSQTCKYAIVLSHVFVKAYTFFSALYCCTMCLLTPRDCASQNDVKGWTYHGCNVGVTKIKAKHCIISVWFRIYTPCYVRNLYNKGGLLSVLSNYSNCEPF